MELILPISEVDSPATFVKMKLVSQLRFLWETASTSEKIIVFGFIENNSFRKTIFLANQIIVFGQM